MKRAFPVLATALGLSLAAVKTLPLEVDDPFRSTLAVLPIVIALLTLVGRWARTHGADRAAPAVPAAELSALLFLVIVILSRGHLGLDRVDGILAAGLFIVLAHHVARLVFSLRTGMGRRVTRRPPWPFFVLPFAMYLAILPWSMGHHQPDGDEPYYLLIAHSLAFDFDTELTNNYESGDSLRYMDREITPQPGDPLGRHGELYSRHNLLLPVVLAPAYRLAGLDGVLVMMALIAAALAWIILRLAHRYFPQNRESAIFAWACVALTPPLLIYSYLVWAEVPAALLAAIGIDSILGIRDDSKHQRRSWVVLSLAIVLLPMLKLRFAVISLGLVIMALWRLDSAARRRVVALGGVLIIVCATILLFNQFAFDNPLKFHDIDGLRSYTADPSRYLLGLTGLFFDCAFGLFSFSPLWAIVIPAVALLAKRRHAVLTDALLVFFLYLLVLLPRGEWYGGWSPPFRYGIAGLPMLSLWLVPALEERRDWAVQVILTVLGVLTFSLTLLWLIEPGWTVNLAQGRSHLLDYLSTSQGVDIARLFPSSIRPRLATWVFPACSTLALLVAWRNPRRLAGPATLWGLCALLLSVILVLAAGAVLPTRVIEFEDPWVKKSGGSLYPDQWTAYRIAYRGGWSLPSRERFETPLVAGGDLLEIALDVRFIGEEGSQATLRVQAGDEILARHEVEPGPWQTLHFPTVEWPAGAPLRLEVVAPDNRRIKEQLVFDRARLTWH